MPVLLPERLARSYELVFRPRAAARDRERGAAQLGVQIAYRGPGTRALGRHLPGGLARQVLRAWTRTQIL